MGPWSPRQQHRLSAIAKLILSINHHAGEENIVADDLSQTHFGFDFISFNAEVLAVAQNSCSKLHTLQYSKTSLVTGSLTMVMFRVPHTPILQNISLVTGSLTMVWLTHSEYYRAEFCEAILGRTCYLCFTNKITLTFVRDPDLTLYVCHLFMHVLLLDVGVKEMNGWWNGQRGGWIFTCVLCMYFH